MAQVVWESGDDGGSVVQFVSDYETITLAAAATATSTLAIPAGAFIVGVTVQNLTALTGAAGFASYTIGDGTTADRWGTGIGITANTTTTSANFANYGAGATEDHRMAAVNVVLTATGGNFATGSVKVAVCYITMGAPDAAAS